MRIIVSEAEHHANLVPWLMVAGQTGARVVMKPAAEGQTACRTCNGASQRLSRRDSRVLAIGQMSNVTGGCPDLALATRQARAAGWW